MKFSKKSLTDKVALPSALFKKINLGDCDGDKEEALEKYDGRPVMIRDIDEKGFIRSIGF